MNRIIILSALVIMVLTSCKKNHDPAPDYYMLARKNSVSWVAPKPYVNIVKDSLIMIGHAGEETLGIRVKAVAGVSHVQDIYATYYTTIGGDVMVSEYRLTPDETNTVNITTYSPEDHYIEGSFKLKFDKLRGPESAPDTITFSAGQVRGLIPYLLTD